MLLLISFLASVTLSQVAPTNDDDALGAVVETKIDWTTGEELHNGKMPPPVDSTEALTET